MGPDVASESSFLQVPWLDAHTARLSCHCRKQTLAALEHDRCSVSLLQTLSHGRPEEFGKVQGNRDLSRRPSSLRTPLLTDSGTKIQQSR